MAARVSLLSSVFVALAQLTSQAAAANGYSVSTSGGTTYMPILGTQTIASGYAASVVAADACSTTYVLACTDSLQCNTQIQGSGTVTEGPYFLAATAQTVLDGATGTGIITCNNDQSSATCTVSEKGVKGSNTFTTALTVSFSLQYAHVPVTAGASLPTGSCTSTAAGAATTSHPGLAAPTNVDLYKVIVPVAAVAAAALI